MFYALAIEIICEWELAIGQGNNPSSDFDVGEIVNGTTLGMREVAQKSPVKGLVLGTIIAAGVVRSCCPHFDSLHS